MQNRNKLLFLTISCLFLVLQSSAQDIHFSQFTRSYLNLNPALTGSFDGDYRFNGNFKNQWNSVSEPYQTYSFAVDAKAPIAAFSNFNVGLLAFKDEAGIGGLKTTLLSLSLSYIKGLNADSTLIAKVGFQTGFTARSINFNQFTFDNQYNGRVFDPTAESGENFDRNSYNSLYLSTGIALEYRSAVRRKFEAGIALFNLNTPNQSFMGKSIPLDERTSFFLSADQLLSEKMDILPSILFSFQGSYTETLMGAELRYRLNGASSMKRNLYGGLWYRNQDAVVLSIGTDYYQWHVGASYDINISGLEVASNNRGGLELSITYIFKDFKPTIRRYKICPAFL
jgi:type IX secretion system PorP/SprF family membrane protein